MPKHPRLDKRAKKDGIAYQQLPGDILTLAGKFTLDHRILARDIALFHERYNIEKMYVDPNRMKALMGKVDELDLDFPEIETINQGYLDMTPCIDMFEEKLRSGHISHGGNILLKRSFAMTRVSRDALRNRRFEKNRSAGRIDPVIAATLACGGMAPRIREKPNKKSNILDFYHAAEKGQKLGSGPRVFGA